MTSRQEKSATQMLNEIVGQVIYQGPFPGLGHTDNAPKWACNVYVNGQLLGSSYGHKNKKDAKEMAAAEAAESLGLM
jgi:dsRNA-specific ribonuclease